MRRTPASAAAALDWLIFEQSGVVTTRQATELLGRAVVRTHLSQRRWRSICRGVLLTENGDLRPPQQLWVAVLACGPDARLAGVSAAAAGGVRGLRPEPIDVLVPAGRTRHDRLARLPPDMLPVRAHRTRVLPEEHCQAGQPPRTSMSRAVIDGASWAASDREAAMIILMACQQRRVEPSELRRALALFPRIARHRMISLTIDEAAGGAGALSEIDLVALCHRFRLPRPELQTRRTDADGRTRFLDAYWEEFHLHVEVDGAHHMDVRQWSADMLRQNRVWISGDRILRFPAWLVRSDPWAVADQIRSALTAAGCRQLTPDRAA